MGKKKGGKKGGKAGGGKSIAAEFEEDIDWSEFMTEEGPGEEEEKHGEEGKKNEGKRKTTQQKQQQQQQQQQREEEGDDDGEDDSEDDDIGFDAVFNDDTVVVAVLLGGKDAAAVAGGDASEMAGKALAAATVREAAAAMRVSPDRIGDHSLQQAEVDGRREVVAVLELRGRTADARRGKGKKRAAAASAAGEEWASPFEMATRLRDSVLAARRKAESAAAAAAATTSDPEDGENAPANRGAGLGDDDDDDEEKKAAKAEGVVPHAARPLLWSVLNVGGPGVEAAAKARKAAESGGGSSWCCRRAVLYPVLMALFFFALVGIRVGEEGFDWDGLEMQPPSEDLYAALGVPRGATAQQISRAYRKGALRWHPDKNPGCGDCAARFALLAKANEVLSDPHKRAVYDQLETSYEPLPSDAVELTADTFDELVLRAPPGSLWVVQIYSDWHRSCTYFSPVWEDAVHRYAANPHVRFGRVHVTQQQALVRRLPARFGVVPTVMSFRGGQFGSSKVFKSDRREAARRLDAFVRAEFPDPVARVGAGPGEALAFLRAASAASGSPSRVLYLPGRKRKPGAAPPVVVRALAASYRGAIEVGYVPKADDRLWNELVSACGRPDGLASAARLLYFRGGPGGQRNPRWVVGAVTAPAIERLITRQVMRPAVVPLSAAAYNARCSAASRGGGEDEGDGGGEASDEGGDEAGDDTRRHADACVIRVTGCGGESAAATRSPGEAEFLRLVAVSARDGARDVQFALADASSDEALLPLCGGPADSTLVVLPAAGRALHAGPGRLERALAKGDDADGVTARPGGAPRVTDRTPPPAVYALGPVSVLAETAHKALGTAAIVLGTLVGYSHMPKVPSNVLQVLFLFLMFALAGYQTVEKLLFGGGSGDDQQW